VTSLAQLNALGLGRAAVAKRAATGRLHRIHRGVYAVGHGRLTGEGHWMAAVLAYGPSARLSHRSAAALWNLRRHNRPKTDISVSGRPARSRAGIDVHTTTTLVDVDCTVVDGIPFTTGQTAGAERPPCGRSWRSWPGPPSLEATSRSAS
jgi:predicted transcriptional regulator of viral defense system